MANLEGLERVLSNQERPENGQFVVDIIRYEGSSERIMGYRRLQECGLITPNPIFVLGHDAFEEYKIRGMTEGLKTEILTAFRQIREKNPHRGVFLGWRTVLLEGELPPGPRTAAVYDEEEYLRTIEATWRFAQEQGYDIEGAEVTLVIHPFIHPAAPPMQESPFLQWPGGDVTPLPDGRLVIRTTWGPDEAVQGYPCDEYTFRTRTLTTERSEVKIEKNVPLKTITLMPKTGSQYEDSSIPYDFQRRQVLRDSQIMEVAEDCRTVQQHFGPHRLEWIVQPEGVTYRECIPFAVRPEDFFFLEGELTQPVVVITSEEDIARVQPPSAIAHLPAELFQTREIVSISTLLATHAKNKDITLLVLAHGSLATQHMVRRFRDLGQSVLFTGDEKISDGEKVRIFRNEESLGRWERVGERPSDIIDLKDIGNVREAAAKARNLGILHEHGIPIPEGFYLSEVPFRQHLTSLSLNQVIRELPEFSGEALQKRCQKIQKEILTSKLPDSLRQMVEEKLEESSGGKFSVRSAELHEDTVVAQAGLFKSHLEVPREAVPQKILECWASAFSPHTIGYLRTVGITPPEIKMAVFIQKMIEGGGGVIYTGKKITISAGTSPEKITSGTEREPHQIVVEKTTGAIMQERFSPKNIILNEEGVSRLVELACQIEDIFGQPQDIEWVIDSEGNICILQARPLS